LREKTLGIIKPDAVSRNLVGEVIRLAEGAGLRVVAQKMLQLSKSQAQGFYQVHRERPFFDSLTNFMSEGPIVVLVFEADRAISTWRRVMGATDPAQAAEGSIRSLFGESIERNAVHGSDSPESASFEIAYFFSALDQMN
jgi:nucleoside-diphosphate kinase